MLKAKDRISYVSLERGDRSNFRTRITCAASGRVPGLTASAARTRTYFLVRPKNARFGAEIRTLLNGYGGVLASLLPSFAGAMGRLWPEQGSAYVVAKLRGGGQFGPRWHEAVQTATKQRIWDDFIAFAEDLIRRKVTSPRRWAWSAAATEVCWWAPRLLSAGTASTQRSCRWRCSTCFGSPSWRRLLLHRRIRRSRHPEQRGWIETNSPCQKRVLGKTYPVPFILTSNKDDRVHLAHGRKAAARLAALGQAHYCYENIDGGHSAAANLMGYARRLAPE